MSQGKSPSAIVHAAAREADRFESALASPERAQQARLEALLRAVQGSRQAQRLGLQRVRGAREFQDAVSLRGPDDVAGDVEDLKRGTPRVLTREPVLRFERTGGSSGASKDVPVTRGWLRELHAGLLPWLHDLASRRPAAFRGPGYWAISPIGGAAATESGIPVGSSDDASYFPTSLRRALAPLLAVPPAVGHLPDIETCRYVTLRLLLQRGDLAFASVWNPSFLTLLMEALDRHAARLLDDLAQGACRPPSSDVAHAERGEFQMPSLRSEPVRARALRAALERDGSLSPRVLWPRLALLSLWTEAEARRALPAVEDRFAGVEIQGKGLLATEGVVTIPLFEAPAPVLAVRSHFYEFLDEADPAGRPRLAHELEHGRTYEVVLSTGAGLLRYRLGDRVRVAGFHQRTPCLRFEGRAADSCDLVGEKLSAARVRDVLSRALGPALNGDRARFAMLAPEWTAPPAYHLFVESAAPDAALDDLSRRVETLLGEGFAYRYARDLGQLGPVRAVRVEDGLARYEERCITLGQRAGDVKPRDLDVRTGWQEWMKRR